MGIQDVSLVEHNQWDGEAQAEMGVNEIYLHLSQH